MTIDKIDTHVDDAIARLPGWLNESVELQKLISVFPERIQELENVAIDLLNKRSLGEAIGEQLNVIGRHVGEPDRLGRDDTDYESAINVRILVNTSIGDKGRLRQIGKLWADADRVTFFDAFPAALIMTIRGGDAVDPDRLGQALDDAKVGGVNLLVVAAFGEPPFAFSTLIEVASDGATIDSNTFSVTHSLDDTQDGDKLIIYDGDVDAGEFTISNIGVSTFDVTPATLTAPRSSIQYDIRRHTENTGGFGALQSDGTNGATTDPDIFDSVGATFQADGVDATSKIFVIDHGLFDIDSVPLEERILSASLLASVGPGATGLTYIIVDPIGAGILAALLN